MPKVRYVSDLTIGDKALTIINKANQIIDEYAAQGYDLTLRQLYYQFVARDLIPNKQSEYKRLGDIVNNGRLAGLIDWSRITDRTRNLRTISTWNGPQGILRASADSYKVDKWVDQSARVEVWIEKDALLGVIERVCEEMEVPYFSCRGYVSQSEMWGAAMRIVDRWKRGKQQTVILHLGDHDPSGIDMSRDILDRLALFSGRHMDASPYRVLDVRRLALNMDQVEQYGPPPNPAKTTDSRFAGYVQEHGDESWELDALEPSVLGDLIEDAILDYRDADKWEDACARQEDQRRNIVDIERNYSRVIEFLNYDPE